MMTLAPECLSILQLSDTHILAQPGDTLLGIDTAYYFRQVLAQALDGQTTYDLIMLTGDLVQDPVSSSYHYLLERLVPHGIPCVCLPGNHDDYALMRHILNTPLVHCQKQVLLKGWQIISLNSQIIGEEGGFLAAEELRFLADCLNRWPTLPTLVAVHHHSLATGSEWMDTMRITNSEEILWLIAQHPQVKVLLNGHIHQVMDRQIGNLRVLGSPSTCFQFTPKSRRFALDDISPGYRLLQLYADGQIATQVKRLSEPLVGLQPSPNGY